MFNRCHHRTSTHFASSTKYDIAGGESEFAKSRQHMSPDPRAVAGGDAPFDDMHRVYDWRPVLLVV